MTLSLLSLSSSFIMLVTFSHVAYVSFHSSALIIAQAPPIRLRLMALYKFALYCIVMAVKSLCV